MASLTSIVKCKCPNCEKGDVYQKHHFFSYAKMNESCEICKYSFDKEPGFFYGAMYVSYAFTVAQCVTIFVACGVLFFDNWFSYYLIPVMVAVLLLVINIFLHCPKIELEHVNQNKKTSKFI